MEATSGKSEELYRLLREEIRNMRVDERFLTIREIMKRFAMSQSVVDRVLTRLRTERYLVAKAGRGLYVSDDALLDVNPEPTQSNEVLLMMPRWVSCDIDEFNAVSVKLNAESPDLVLKSDYFDYATPVPRNLDERLAQAAGLIVVPSSSSFDVQDFAAIMRYSEIRPTAIFGHHFASFKLFNIGLADDEVAQTAMYHLWRHGHRKIGLLLSEPHSTTIMTRVRSALNFGKLHGMSVQIVDCHVASGEVAATKTFDCFVKLLDGGIDFTALLGIAGESMIGAINACLNNKIRIPEDLSMAAIAGENLTRTVNPPIDTVPNDCAGQLAAALQGIRFMRNGAPGTVAPNLYWSTDMIVRGSVRDISTSNGLGKV